MTLNYLGGTGKGDTQRKRNEDIDLKGGGEQQGTSMKNIRILAYLGLVVPPPRRDQLHQSH